MKREKKSKFSIKWFRIKRAGTNLNYLFEQYGISVNNDSVVRTAFYKYFHPKEALIDQGILDPEISRIALNRPKEDRRR